MTQEELIDYLESKPLQGLCKSVWAQYIRRAHARKSLSEQLFIPGTATSAPLRDWLTALTTLGYFHPRASETDELLLTDKGKAAIVTYKMMEGVE